jgi:hypothetical protein
MSAIRRHLFPIGIVWLMFQSGVLAASPFLDCCSSTASQAAVEDDACCKGMAPGQICPLHKHRHAPPTQSHHDDVAGPVLRCGCGSIDPALISLAFGLGVLPAPVSVDVTLVSSSVPPQAFERSSAARALDPPPPRA